MEFGPVGLKIKEGWLQLLKLLILSNRLLLSKCQDIDHSVTPILYSSRCPTSQLLGREHNPYRASSVP